MKHFGWKRAFSERGRSERVAKRRKGGRTACGCGVGGGLLGCVCGLCGVGRAKGVRTALHLSQGRAGLVVGVRLIESDCGVDLFFINYSAFLPDDLMGCCECRRMLSESGRSEQSAGACGGGASDLSIIHSGAVLLFIKLF